MAAITYIAGNRRGADYGADNWDVTYLPNWFRDTLSTPINNNSLVSLDTLEIHYDLKIRNL